jgi:hypothetical protein
MKIDRKAFGPLAKGYKLAPLLDKHIGKGDFEWTFDYEPKRADDAWHPSGDCTPTLFQLYKSAKTRQVEEISTSLYKTFMVGHFWHQYIQTLLLNGDFCDTSAIERSGYKSWDSVNGEPMKPFRWVTGSADVAPVTIPRHGDYLLDIKTMNGHDFRSNGIPAWTKDKWECQVNIYMDFFDFDKAMILGVMKDSPHDFKEFEFERNDELIDALYKKWKLVSACLDEDVAPPEDEEYDLPLVGPIR